MVNLFPLFTTENTFYSAVSVDFMKKRKVFMRTGSTYLSTEDKISWFNGKVTA